MPVTTRSQSRAQSVDVATQSLKENYIVAQNKNPCQPPDIRWFLSSLHTVLLKNTAWKPISINKLKTPNQIKLAYRTAVNILHPSKHDNNIDYQNAFYELNTLYSDYIKSNSCQVVKRNYPKRENIPRVNAT